MKKPLISGLIFIMVGLIINLVTFRLFSIQLFSISLKEFFISIGSATFILGLFSIIIQLPDWKRYFEKSITSIVIKQDYLKNLNKEELINLQTKTHEAFYKTTDITREGSFLNYTNEVINNFIGQPYRENLMNQITIEGVQDNVASISDTLTYVCRLVGDSIQDKIILIEEYDEFEKTLEYKIELIFPFKEKRDSISINLLQDEFKSIHKDKTIYSYDISEYMHIDKLVIRYFLKYLIRVNNGQSWQMVIPSKDIHVSFRFPDEYNLRIVPYLLQPEHCLIDKGNGWANLQYLPWLLPNQGFNWELINK